VRKRRHCKSRTQIKSANYETRRTQPHQPQSTARRTGPFIGQQHWLPWLPRQAATQNASPRLIRPNPGKVGNKKNFQTDYYRVILIF